jgi:hypothetical protein
MCSASMQEDALMPVGHADERGDIICRQAFEIA